MQSFGPSTTKCGWRDLARLCGTAHGAGTERQEHIACAVGVSRPACRQHDDDHPAKLIVGG